MASTRATVSPSPVVTRAAVVIGVNNTGGLTPLRAAVSGAEEVQRWLAAEPEKFEVTALLDTGGEVTIEAVKRAVRKYVDLGTVKQLVIFFAGHGYLNDTAEIWLLSRAPQDPDEAVDQTSSTEFARFCGIPSVVMISDACRSIPLNLQANRVRGSSIFPNLQNNVEVEVDRFFACKPGDPALELTVDEARRSYAGLFTEMLRRIHIDPGQRLTRTIRLEGTDVVVVPSRRLKEVLPDYVNDAAQSRSIRLAQKPQLRLECGEETFLARAAFTAAPQVVRGGPEGSPPGGPREADPVPPPQDPAFSSEVTAALTDPVFRRDLEGVLEADRTQSFETQAGVEITGTEAAWVHGVGIGAHIAHEKGSNRFVRLHSSNNQFDRLERPGSVILQFKDGTGTVLAALPNYIAAVNVDGGRIVNVSYVPSQNSPIWNEYASDRASTERLRAIAATAARHGMLAVARDEAKNFADRVRQMKRYDPTLGIYAAVAYADLGLRNDAKSVQDYMRRDLNADIFDVALLAGTMKKYLQNTSELPTVPFCPMLSQTWSFLRPRGVELPGVLAQAGHHRRSALWTTFEAEAMSLLREAAELGELP